MEEAAAQVELSFQIPSSPKAAEEKIPAPVSADELEIVHIPSDEQDTSTPSASAQITSLPQVVKEVLNLKNACVSAFQDKFGTNP